MIAAGKRSMSIFSGFDDYLLTAGINHSEGETHADKDQEAGGEEATGDG